MKIRSGFVSNSSSSSFVIVASKEAHKAALSKLTEYQKAVIEQLITKEKILGQDAFVIGELNTDGGYSYLYDEGFQPDDWEEGTPGWDAAEAAGECLSPADALFSYKEEIEKQPKETWYKWSQG